MSYLIPDSIVNGLVGANHINFTVGHMIVDVATL